ncbi:hypothetical protein DFH07DRAFT_951783 [Mycena maculata]|uniref:Uncharacterized protein n=1 Tax=Mycena maculata TaxID=230809 RepID=A0AAD7K288_9AGAR|nr:hypothetical protein DFH07DRAFT_951783 [Mycena maculata]
MQFVNPEYPTNRFFLDDMDAQPSIKFKKKKRLLRRPAQAPARLDPIPPRRWPRPPPPDETLKAMKFFFEDPANEEQWQAWVDKLVKIMWSDGEVIPWDDDKKIAAGVCLTADLEAGSDQPLSEEEVPRKVGRKAEKMREYRAWLAEFEEAELRKPTWKWPESSGQTSAGWMDYDGFEYVQ